VAFGCAEGEQPVRDGPGGEHAENAGRQRRLEGPVPVHFPQPAGTTDPKISVQHHPVPQLHPIGVEPHELRGLQARRSGQVVDAMGADDGGAAVLDQDALDHARPEPDALIVE
jgi:hypothetical protein